MHNKADICRRIKSKARQMKDDSVVQYIKRPVFTLSGNREFVAQGHISVEKYTDTEIILRVDKMNVTVSGSSLLMCFYNRHTVKLSGFIASLDFK